MNLKVTLGALLFTGMVANAADFDASKVKYIETRTDIDKPQKGEKGFIRIIGEFHNGTDKWLRNLCVDVDYLDAQGKSIAVSSISTITRAELNKGSADSICADQTFVGPGQTVAFKKIRDQKFLAGTYASHRVSPATALVVEPPPTLVIEGFKAEKTESRTYASFAISGTLKNTGKQTCRHPQITLGLYTKDGKLYDVSSASVSEKLLAPGQSLPFTRRAVPDPQKVITEVRPTTSCMSVQKDK
jgi:hypothetical protein